MASLIAPIGYTGELRPYYTIYDEDHTEFQKQHDMNKLKGCILGTTNPIMTKAFNKFPNVVYLKGASLERGREYVKPKVVKKFNLKLSK